MVSPSSNFLKINSSRACPTRTWLCFNPTSSLSSWRFARFSNPPTSPSSTAISSSVELASIVAGNSHKRLEVGLIGSEGMTGLPIVLGNDRSPHENFIQVAGEGSRILADKLREAMRQSRSLEKAFLKFAHSS